MNQKIELRQVRDFGELVNDTFVFARQNFKPLFKSVIYICGFFIIAHAVTATFQNINMQNMLKDGSIGKSPFGMLGWEYALNIVSIIAFYNTIIITVLAYINLYREKGNIPPEVDEVWGQVKYYFFKMLVALVLLLIFNMIGFVFCILPGIYLWPLTSLMLAAIIFENSTLSYTFNQSFKLIKENWWITFGALFIVTLIVYAVSFILVLPATLLNTGSMLFVKSPMSMPMIILSSILQSISMIFMILPFITISLAYFSLIEKKEGVGLQDKVNMIGQNNADSDLPEEQY